MCCRPTVHTARLVRPNIVVNIVHIQWGTFFCAFLFKINNRIAFVPQMVNGTIKKLKITQHKMQSIVPPFLNIEWF